MVVMHHSSSVFSIAKTRRPFARGFTLLEILVVISIIGILIAFGAVAFSTAQRKGRDARRTADMKAIQSAQEQHYANTGSYTTLANPCGASGAFLAILSPFPVDPRSPATQYACPTSTATTYCACAELESSAGNSGPGCNFSATTHFCVRQLQ
jgi:prepilin-type N-terminal cleavage/methylation domain-containing protein